MSTHASTSATTLGGRWWRRVAVATAVGCSGSVVSLGTGGWYLAGRLVDAGPVVEAYPLRVKSVDPDRGTVTLTRGDDAVEPGTFRLSWVGGRATVGPVVGRDSTGVTRRLTGVVGRLSPGTRVGVQPNPYTGDPMSALGLPFTTVSVPSPGLTGDLPAWFVAGPRRTWAVLVHGLGGSRTDTLAAMPTLAALGFPMLAVSVRNDPGAVRSDDGHSHLGDTEWRDVEAAVRFARAQGAAGVVLWGWSLGGGMSAVVSESSTESGAVRALVLDSPLLDWRDTLSAAARRKRLPGILTWATRVMLRHAHGIRLERYDVARLAAGLSVPTLVVHGGADAVVPAEVTERFALARPDLVTYLRVPGANHVSAIDTDPDGYAAATRRLLDGLP